MNRYTVVSRLKFPEGESQDRGTNGVGFWVRAIRFRSIWSREVSRRPLPWDYFRVSRDTPSIGSHDTESNQKQFSPTGLLGSQRAFTCPVAALIKHLDYFRCAIRPRQAHFRMFSDRK